MVRCHVVAEKTQKALVTFHNSLYTFSSSLRTARCLSSMPQTMHVNPCSGDPIIHTDSSWLHPNLEAQNALFADLHTDAHCNSECNITHCADVAKQNRFNNKLSTVPVHATNPFPNSEAQPANACSCAGDPIIHTQSSWLHPNLESQNALFFDLYPNGH